ncbi:hypothetical protein SADUNF_Sadunf13G0031200 [Salix dunnii]|uniref:Retrotransposon Copia-like N-terminal domain-containing protein n=1 Tax=Salix dunnii TaxID=1413687 RepID=A0A835JKJ1_9ROSI|nr:hypothetical protein SADUNF_Sadunf13G0031200 [Salix dunnii]
MEEQTPTSQSANIENPKHVSSYFNFTNPNNPYRIENGDHTSLVLVTELLTTENYITWSRAMRRALRAKNKLCFISGSVSKPTDEEDPLFEMWERCNDMVVSWIQNAVSIDIKHTLAFVDDAQVVWTELKDRFTQQNGPRIFQLRRDLANLRQDRDSVSAYFGNLKTLWDEMIVYNPMPLCTCGQSKMLNERYQRDYVIQFLMGLNDQYTNARDQIMLIEPLPSINKVESMALASKYVNAPFKTGNRNFTRKEMPYCQHCHTQGHTLENCYKAGNAEPPVCSHCNVSGHVIEKCYKIHGYPLGHKLYRGKVAGSFANQVAVSTSPKREEVIAISVKSSIDVNGLWHCRLGHISNSRMKLIDDPAVKDNLLINEISPYTQEYPCPNYSPDFHYSPQSTDDISTSPSTPSTSSSPASTPKDLSIDNSYVSLDPIDHNTSSPSPHMKLRKSTRNRTAPAYLQDFHCQQAAITSDLQSMAQIPLPHPWTLPPSETNR